MELFNPRTRMRGCLDTLLAPLYHLCVFAPCFARFLQLTLREHSGACVMSKSETAESVSTTPAVLSQDRDPRNRNWPLNVAKDGASRQRAKIRQIAKALREAGFVTLSEQVNAIGLSRSTTWKILQADHKTSGLSARLIGRMLSHKELPLGVRLVLREYVIEKAQGHYGHNLACRRRFAGYFWDMPELAGFLKNERSSPVFT